MPVPQFQALNLTDLDAVAGGFAHTEPEERYVSVDPEAVALEMEEEGQREARALRERLGF